jgi:hypothetical protein
VVSTPVKELENRGIDIYQERPVGQKIIGYERPEDIPIYRLTRNIPETESYVCTIPAYDGENLPVPEL